MRSADGKFVSSVDVSIVDGAKTCTGCGVNQPLHNFVKNRHRADGYEYRCKPCQKQWRHDHYRPGSTARLLEANRKRGKQNLRYRIDPKFREARQAASRILARSMKDQTFSAYGGYVCACCGELEKAFLQLDHIANDGGSHRRMLKATGGIKLHRWLRDNGYPPIMQVLCANCNFGKRMNGGVCPHASSK